VELTFLGATNTVTGSKYLVRSEGRTVLVDCGLFQGFKRLRLRNWEPLPVDPRAIDAVVLTHAHIDHSGYLPLLVRNGFAGPVFATSGTRDLCEILLPDAGHLQEEDAKFAARAGYSKHRPPKPLYTEADAAAVLPRLRSVAFGERVDLGGGLGATLRPAGHIIGASTVVLDDGRTSVLFSGDLGRAADPVMPPPSRVRTADYLVVESTYGDRRHPDTDPQAQLAEVVVRTASRGGVVLIPAFAVGRAQTILYLIRRLKVAGAIPDVPVFLDSPMAARATEVFRAHAAELRLTPAECDAVCDAARYVTTPEESKRLSASRDPMVLVSASGMATGGRVLHHLEAFAPDARNTIVLAGFQAAGTRGAALAAGADAVKIHGDYVPVRADVVMLENLSAHADYEEILAWLGGLARPPRTSFVTHGEPAAADALRLRIVERLGWEARVPDYRDTVVLDRPTRARGRRGG
jgi:metallo-beta-lactamase family protein